ncbi:nicotinamide riboside kinase [Staphylotrichum tortipilum]|uniref:Nicotinamide riboside kinase n=1 Tax=Staphylotrichum tortipilum TaxID=2831512 RepID=A0AAN6MIT9_9PEZI|nr:nicotinamide riboside kinase [Staphylotrichum longicolle]
MADMTDMADMDKPRTLIIGISGCSSSGKTTLARLLRDMFPNTFILHEDDFYKPEAELPTKNGLTDWDCPEAISIPDLEAALVHIRETGTFPVSTCSRMPACSRRSSHGCPCAPSPPLPPLSPPLTPPSHSQLLQPQPTTNSPLITPATKQPSLTSKEDLNTIGPCPASPSQIAACTAAIQAWLAPPHPGSLIFSPSKNTRICLLDGFLLYSPPLFAKVMALLDVKLFLHATRDAAVRRREARDGYVTLEGFWKDPPGYVEGVVWPNYVQAHRWMFEGGDVERGVVDGAVVWREGVVVAPEGEFGGVLEWAVRVVRGEVERVCLGEADGVEVNGKE